MQTTQLFILIFQGLLTVAGFMAGFIIKSMDNRIKDLEKDYLGLKDNYLDRFEKVMVNQNEVKLELIKEQTKVKEELIREKNSIKEELIKNQTNVKEELMKELNSLHIEIARIK